MQRGVVIVKGAQSWQIIQQQSGFGMITLSVEDNRVILTFTNIQGYLYTFEVGADQLPVDVALSTCFQEA